MLEVRGFADRGLSLVNHGQLCSEEIHISEECRRPLCISLLRLEQTMRRAPKTSHINDGFDGHHKVASSLAEENLRVSSKTLAR